MKSNSRVMKPQFWHTTALAWRLVEFLCPEPTWGEWWRGVTPPQSLGKRKKRLLAAACVRPLWPLLVDAREERGWVDWAEASAECLVPHQNQPLLPCDERDLYRPG